MLLAVCFNFLAKEETENICSDYISGQITRTTTRSAALTCSSGQTVGGHFSREPRKKKNPLAL